jgi:transposase
LELLDQLDPKIVELTAAVVQEANQRPEVLLLRTHSGVGPTTGLTYVLVIGTQERFPSGKQIGSYVGLIPCEDSNAGRQRLGHINKGQRSTRLAASVSALMMRREKNLPKSPWPENLPFGCTGCGAMAGTIRSWSSSVRTRESS